MNIKRVVGDNIRGFRHKAGWTQEKLAVRSKLHYNYIGSVERAEDNISIESIFKITKALKIPSFYLFIENCYQLSDEKLSKLIIVTL